MLQKSLTSTVACFNFKEGEKEEEEEVDAEPEAEQTASGRAGGMQQAQMNETISKMRQVLRTGD